MPDTPLQLAKPMLEDLLRRCESEKLADLPEFDTHRNLLRAAVRSTNGAVDKIGAMAETQGLLVAHIVQQGIREPDRLAAAFARSHSCPVAPLITHDAEGHPVMPWTKALEEYAARDSADAPGESLTLGIPKWKLGVTVTGKSVKQFIWASAALLAVLLYGYIQKQEFAKVVDSKVSSVIAQAEDIGRRATKDASEQEARAVTRSESVKEEVRAITAQ